MDRNTYGSQSARIVKSYGAVNIYDRIRDNG